jgi:acetoin utilization protein AcuB
LPRGGSKAERMKNRKKIPIVGAVMTSFPYFIDVDADVATMEKLMAQHQIRHLPVQKDGKLVGIVTERDLYYRIKRNSPAEETAGLTARDFMIDHPYMVAFSTPLSECAAEMARRRIGSAIVVRRGKLAGIISAIDICRIFAEYLNEQFGSPSGGDAA